MALTTGTTKLSLAFKTLRVRWLETTARWDDPVRRAFEEEHWTALEAEVLSTLRAADRLAQVLARARQDCE